MEWRAEGLPDKQGFFQIILFWKQRMTFGNSFIFIPILRNALKSTDISILYFEKIFSSSYFTFLQFDKDFLREILYNENIVEDRG